MNYKYSNRDPKHLGYSAKLGRGVPDTKTPGGHRTEYAADCSSLVNYATGHKGGHKAWEWAASPQLSRAVRMDEDLEVGDVYVLARAEGGPSQGVPATPPPCQYTKTTDHPGGWSRGGD